MAGTLHPKPIKSGTTDLPVRENRRKTPSVKNAARAIYPLASISDKSKKRSKIWGKKHSTSPTPPKIPSSKSE